MTGNLKIISDSRIRYIVSKGSKYRFPSRIDLKIKLQAMQDAPPLQLYPASDKFLM